MQLLKNAIDQFEPVGSISLNEKVLVSDPCYTPATWCTATLENVCPGTYKAYILKEKYPDGSCRVFGQLLIHEKAHLTDVFEWVAEDIGVDSGTCGISDYDFFVEKISADQEMIYHSLITKIDNPNFIEYDDYLPRKELIAEIENKPDEKNELLLKLFEVLSEYQRDEVSYPTIKKYNEVALFPQAIFSFSGYGDGSYDIYVQKDDDQEIIAMLLDFGADIFETDDEDDDEDC